MGIFKDEGRDLVAMHVYRSLRLHWRFYEASETTLGDHDRLIRKPARSVRQELDDGVRPARSAARRGKVVRVRSEPRTSVMRLAFPV
jgi:hypothetical protein